MAVGPSRDLQPWRDSRLMRVHARNSKRARTAGLDRVRAGRFPASRRERRWCDLWRPCRQASEPGATARGRHRLFCRGQRRVSPTASGSPEACPPRCRGGQRLVPHGGGVDLGLSPTVPGWTEGCPPRWRGGPGLVPHGAGVDLVRIGTRCTRLAQAKAVHQDGFRCLVGRWVLRSSRVLP